MKSYINIFVIVLLSILLAGNPIDGRKNPKDYWGYMMKEQDMPEAIKDFINQRSFGSFKEEKAIKDFIKDFEPIPNVSVYHDDINPKQVMKSSSADCNLHHEKLASKKLAVAHDFEPIPNVSVYND